MSTTCTNVATALNYTFKQMGFIVFICLNIVALLCPILFLQYFLEVILIDLIHVDEAFI